MNVIVHVNNRSGSGHNRDDIEDGDEELWTGWWDTPDNKYEWYITILIGIAYITQFVLAFVNSQDSRYNQNVRTIVIVCIVLSVARILGDCPKILCRGIGVNAISIIINVLMITTFPQYFYWISIVDMVLMIIGLLIFTSFLAVIRLIVFVVVIVVLLVILL